jgi:hypothetical protein
LRHADTYMLPLLSAGIACNAVQEGFVGSWDTKRLLNKTDYKNLEKNKEKESDSIEGEKIRQETDYVEEQTRQYLQSMIAYIDTTEVGIRGNWQAAVPLT